MPNNVPNSTVAKQDSPQKPKPMTKVQLKAKLAEETGLNAKQISSVLEALVNTCAKELNRKGIGAFTIPGLVKVVKFIKPASKEKQGRNPATGQPMTIKAKPARNGVRARALKVLKDSVL